MERYTLFLTYNDSYYTKKLTCPFPALGYPKLYPPISARPPLTIVQAASLAHTIPHVRLHDTSPIVSTVFSSSSAASSSHAPAPISSNLILFHRKQQQLESDLQILLDAQAEGLVAGLEGNNEDQTSTGSSTPTVQSLNLRARSRTPVRKPAKLSLRSARKGIHTTIRKLALLKAQEAQYLDPDVEECNAMLDQISAWEHKRDGLDKATQKIRSGQQSGKASRLRKEANEMQDEINAMEARLAELKQHQRKLRRQAEEVENTVQARLSSYTSSMSMLEADIMRFLQTAKPERLSADARFGAGRGQNEVFWQLPPGRRTLEMAKETWEGERNTLVRKQEEIEAEQEALQDGAVVWKDVVKDVSEFEMKLREEMAGLSRPGNHNKDLDNQDYGTGDRDVDGHDGSSSGGVNDILALLDQTTRQLESKFKLAETRNWRLLMCAIGAELDAFRKGRQILEDALGIAAENGDEEAARSAFLSRQSASSPSHVPATEHSTREDSSGDEIRGLDQAFNGRRHGNGVSDTETEDDGPDPELLISHQDTDTE
ncbi:hypothetical protein H2203_003535 [Taxawa tesnikishii (nom. ined.)]|nr:hypothetical protein H2203_003535 [Dothideales sp. JES 119]